MSNVLGLMHKLGVAPQVRQPSQAAQPGRPAAQALLPSKLMAFHARVKRDALAPVSTPVPHPARLQPACYVITLQQMARQGIGHAAYTTIAQMKVRGRQGCAPT